MNSQKILAVVTNIPEFAKAGYRTGLWLGELVHFLEVAEDAGFFVQVASPWGGWIPIDPESLVMQEAGAMIGLEGDVHKRYADRHFMDTLANTPSILDLNLDEYAAVYLTGGHGVMFDFRRPGMPELVEDFFKADKVVSSICHGSAGLLEARRPDGEYFLSGRRATGFSWKEEELANRAEVVPFNNEELMQERGAIYEKATIPFAAHVVVDGKLITGQNPRSATGVAKAVVASLGNDE